MSEMYPTGPNGNGTQIAGYPGVPQQRSFDQPPMQGQPMPGDYAPQGLGGTPPYGPSQPGAPLMPKAPLPRWVLAALGGAVVLLLALGGLTFSANGKAGDAQTKADGLSESLKKANESVAAKQSQLDSQQKELETAQQSGEQAGAALDVALSCATQLDATFDLIIAGSTTDQVQAAYDASREACDQVTEAQSSAE